MFFELKMIFCVMILVSCCLGAVSGFGRITMAPRHVALVGSTATLECCNGFDHRSIQWRRVSLGTVESSDIYLGESGGFVDDFRGGRFNFSNGNTSGCYNLIISGIGLDDAGKYTCAAEYDTSYSASTNVTIHEPLVCYEVYPKDVYMGTNEFELEPDVIELTCSVNYRGSFAPEMQWKWENATKFSNPEFITRNSSLNSTSIVTVAAKKEFDGNKITCFVQSRRDEDLSRNAANWTSKLYRVNYAIFSKKTVINCTEEELKLECNPNCSVSLRDINGSYVCEISYSNETKQYVDLIYEGEHEEIPHWTFAEVAAIILSVAVVALGFVVGILIYRPRKIQVQVNRKLSNEVLVPNVKDNSEHSPEGEVPLSIEISDDKIKRNSRQRGEVCLEMENVSLHSDKE